MHLGNCSKMCRIQHITNLHGRLILNNGKLIRCFESTYCAILLNSFYFHNFSFFECYRGFIYTSVCLITYRTEDVTHFYSSLTVNNGKSIRNFESPYYPLLLNSFYISILKYLSFSCVSKNFFTITISLLAEYSDDISG